MFRSDDVIFHCDTHVQTPAKNNLSCHALPGHRRTDEELQRQRMRMITDKALGFGTRILDVPKGAFMPVRGAVILHVPAEAVSSFSEVAEPTDEK